MTRRAGIWAKVYLIVGSPGETPEDIPRPRRCCASRAPTSCASACSIR
jgi:hypothetical protein